MVETHRCYVWVSWCGTGDGLHVLEDVVQELRVACAVCDSVGMCVSIGLRVSVDMRVSIGLHISVGLCVSAEMRDSIELRVSVGLRVPVDMCESIRLLVSMEWRISIELCVSSEHISHFVPVDLFARAPEDAELICDDLCDVITEYIPPFNLGIVPCPERDGEGLVSED